MFSNRRGKTQFVSSLRKVLFCDSLVKLYCEYIIINMCVKSIVVFCEYSSSSSSHRRLIIWSLIEETMRRRGTPVSCAIFNDTACSICRRILFATNFLLDRWKNRYIFALQDDYPIFGVEYRWFGRQGRNGTRDWILDLFSYVIEYREGRIKKKKLSLLFRQVK